MTPAPDLTRMVPGFEFLQNLMKGAGAAVPGMLPGMSQWVAPTLDPAEIQKRIDELKTVQFWLEQNARLLAATVQALEVQRMTLSTLQTMNLPMVDLQNALKLKPQPERTASPAAPAASPPASPPPSASASGSGSAPPASAPDPTAAEASKSPPPAVDPMQWWTALTQQFGEIVKDSAAAMAAGQTGLPGSKPSASAASTEKPTPASTAARKAAGNAAPRKPASRSRSRGD